MKHLNKINPRILERAERITTKHPDHGRSGITLLMMIDHQLACGTPYCYSDDDERLYQEFNTMPMKLKHELLDILRMKYGIPLTVDPESW
jgi:hypothetical protein